MMNDSFHSSNHQLNKIFHSDGKQNHPVNKMQKISNGQQRTNLKQNHPVNKMQTDQNKRKQYGHTTTYEHKNTTHTAHKEDAAQIHTVPNAPQRQHPTQLAIDDDHGSKSQVSKASCRMQSELLDPTTSTHMSEATRTQDHTFERFESN